MLLPPRAPHFDAALRDAREASPRGRATAALVLGEPPKGREREARVALEKLVKDAEPDVRFAAMASLGRIGDLSVLPAAIAGIEDAESTVREAAVIAVGRIGGPLARAALRRALTSDHGEVRFQLAPALIEVEGEEARTDVIVLLADERPTVRANTVRALRSLGPHAPTGMRLTRLLSDEDPETRIEAALTLAEWGEERAAVVLRKGLALPNLPEERLFEMLDALGRLGDREAATPLFRLATAMLKPRAVKAAAAAALARIGDPRGTPLLRGYLTGFLGDLREYVLGVVGALGLVALEEEVLLLVKKPRGVAPEALAAALTGLAPKSERSRAVRDEILARGGELASAIRAHEAEIVAQAQAEHEASREEPEGDGEPPPPSSPDGRDE